MDGGGYQGCSSSLVGDPPLRLSVAGQVPVTGHGYW